VAVETLLAEDNRGDVVMLTEAFQQAALDYRLHTARDGQEAIALLKGDAGDVLPGLGLIILDLNLPRINGFEILRFLLARPELGGIATVIVTTSAWEDNPTECISHEAFFQKPSLLSDWVAMATRIDAYRRERASHQRAS
jgi:two-component system response regulator